ncbi:hypothetical protein N7474_010570 [Penicillium riverlandense]|uniref:uncharacterized protein n=1 Tax=Penicillium riverlandense TaxID=1903569 RepID=UPI00254783E7|nr:uncharacterized protein N7474_010570 [Penicillium riverlandense]KAJ5806978.1 hypothetical protein N7474_010570 [Penicillium riverlandense]
MSASGGISTTGHGAANGWVLPPVEQITAELSPSPPSLTKGTETIDSEEQKEMFWNVQNIIQKADEGTSYDLKELHASLEQADADSRRGGRNVESLDEVRTILYKLWSCNSEYLAQTAEALANGSRDSSWRAPYGQSGILKFFLEVIASTDEIGTDLLLHSLRLVGNSCADTDENREIVVKDNYTLAILRYFLNPALVFVAIPVLYNICMDFEPAHAQMAANKTAYILLSLLRGGSAIQENDALLEYAYDLIELATEQGVEQSPDGTVLLLTELALDTDTTLPHFSTSVNSLSTYLEKERFQNACVSNDMVPQLLEILQRSFTIEVDQSSSEDTQTLSQLRLKINQSLGEVSASSLFAEKYPLDSELAQKLKSWVIASEDQLQICACVMLGNLARSDEVCTAMVRDLKIHEELISVLRRNNARAAVLHSTLGFLKNLTIAGDNNRLSLGVAGLIPAVSRLWELESVPQVQFAAASIVRQIIISSMENISRLLAPFEQETDSSGNSQTYLSLLLSLFNKTDSSPIKTEIGRTIASICRTLSPKSRDGDQVASSLLDRLYNQHEGIARPVGAMITQAQWPVVRSEGWFALALMATSHAGCVAVSDCLQNTEVSEVLQKTMSDDTLGDNEETNPAQTAKDRDNIVVLVQELLKNESGALPTDYRSIMEDMMKNHASQHLMSTKQD